MTIYIEIRDDNNEPVWSHEGPLNVPKEMKTPLDKPFRDPKNGAATYGFTYQPIVKAILKNQ